MNAKPSSPNARHSSTPQPVKADVSLIAVSRPLIKKGQQVHILPQWQDEGDGQLTWFAYDDEDSGRVGIYTPRPEMFIQPWQMVDSSMLEEGQ